MDQDTKIARLQLLLSQPELTPDEETEKQQLLDELTQVLGLAEKDLVTQLTPQDLPTAGTLDPAILAFLMGEYEASLSEELEGTMKPLSAEERQKLIFLLVLQNRRKLKALAAQKLKQNPVLKDLIHQETTGKPTTDLHQTTIADARILVERLAKNENLNLTPAVEKKAVTELAESLVLLSQYTTTQRPKEISEPKKEIETLPPPPVTERVTPGTPPPVAEEPTTQMVKKPAAPPQAAEEPPPEDQPITRALDTTELAILTTLAVASAAPEYHPPIKQLNDRLENTISLADTKDYQTHLDAVIKKEETNVTVTTPTKTPTQAASPTPPSPETRTQPAPETLPQTPPAETPPISTPPSSQTTVSPQSKAPILDPGAYFVIDKQEFTEIINDKKLIATLPTSESKIKVITQKIATSAYREDPESDPSLNQTIDHQRNNRETIHQLVTTSIIATEVTAITTHDPKLSDKIEQIFLREIRKAEEPPTLNIFPSAHAATISAVVATHPEAELDPVAVNLLGRGVTPLTIYINAQKILREQERTLSGEERRKLIKIVKGLENASPEFKDEVNTTTQRSFAGRRLKPGGFADGFYEYLNISRNRVLGRLPTPVARYLNPILAPQGFIQSELGKRLGRSLSADWLRTLPKPIVDQGIRLIAKNGFNKASRFLAQKAILAGGRMAALKAAALAIPGIGPLAAAALEIGTRLLKYGSKILNEFSKAVWGEKVRKVDLAAAAGLAGGAVMSGIAALGAGASAALAATFAAAGAAFMTLFIASAATIILYIAALNIAPILSTIVHLESGISGGFVGGEIGALSAEEVDAYGSCPLTAPYYISQGSLRNNTGHGSSAYWGGNTPSYSIPIQAMYPSGCGGKSCPYYGFAADVAPSPGNANPRVIAPKLCGDPTNCQDLTWTRVSRIVHPYGWGTGYVLRATGNGHTWQIYLAHLNNGSQVGSTITSGTVMGTLAQNLSRPHVHIELNVDGVPVRPDFLCQ